MTASQGKIAIITGGATVFVADIDADGAERIADAIRTGPLLEAEGSFLFLCPF